MAICVISAVAVFMVNRSFSNASAESTNAIEALSATEVNKEALEKMLMEPIWDLKLYYDPVEEETKIFCVTTGTSICPVTHLWWL